MIAAHALMFNFGIVSLRPTNRIYQIVLLMRANHPSRSKATPYLFRSGAPFALDRQRLPWELVDQLAGQSKPG